MRIGLARENASVWVYDYARKDEGYLGAYFSGSTVGRSDEDMLPVGSDVDIVVVKEGELPPQKLGKFMFRNTLIEVTYISSEQLESAERVLRSYHLAGSFRMNTLIDDPTGKLSLLQAQVSKQFAEKKWVQLRCEEARNRVQAGLCSLNSSSPLYEQVMSWLFPTGVMTHVLLVAALRNPTVRLRYLAAREVLSEYGYEEFYPKLLHVLGCEDWTPSKVQRHVDGLEQTFDTAASVAQTAFFFSSDITSEARSIAIDGSRELIRTGNHREAVFWITATFARCHHILAADASDAVRRSFEPAFDSLLVDLGVHTPQDLVHRSEEAIRLIPELWEIAEKIMLAHPLVT
ncbi:hypothetical protein GRF59_00660 [Paenibacillus sp. HJL G12]|uniref:Nucleotidyltransferase domain-containing protein n=1 Tax=Paenibacillus dendrobii TaxID=2691084 RepID=A0A7X3LG51_9BACL|nr:hypothetical protein [Paenibacillus dendrobii]MWV42128.1 hypothetical protein [Paenibacillus dendrobii]